METKFGSEREESRTRCLLRLHRRSRRRSPLHDRQARESSGSSGRTLLLQHAADPFQNQWPQVPASRPNKKHKDPMKADDSETDWYLVHRIDKETSGVLCLARKRKRALISPPNSRPEKPRRPILRLLKRRDSRGVFEAAQATEALHEFRDIAQNDVAPESEGGQPR